MAYHFTLAFFPTIIFVVAIFGLIGQQQQLYPQIVNFLEQVVPPNSVLFLKNFINRLFEESTGDIALLSLVITIWAASNGAHIVVKALNRIVFERDEQAGFFRQRLMALILVMVFAVVLVLSSNIVVFSSVFFDFLQEYTFIEVEQLPFYHWYDMLIFMFIVTLFSSYVYGSISERKHLSFFENLPGSLFFVVIWLGLSRLFGLYIEYAGAYKQIYGTLGAAIVFMIWLYLTSLVFLVGGELNMLIHKRRELVPE